MTWSDFYLFCFAVGFFFSVFSFLLGGLHWHLPFGIHLPQGWGLGGHAPASGHGGAAHGAQGGAMSAFNPVTTAAFLAWFGGTGYLMTRFPNVVSLVTLVVALGAGLVGAGIMFLFLTRVLSSRDEAMAPADYEMIGVLGRTSIPIREGGTGEIIYSQAGTRRTCGARAEDNTAIEKGCEVVVTRYDKGIAYVKRWEELNPE